MRLERFLEDSARRFPAKPAIVLPDRRITYEELDQRATALARGLLQHGLQRGGRVVIFLENSIETVVALFAVSRAGAVFSVVSPSVKTDKLAFILNDSEATAIVTQASLWPVAEAAVAEAATVGLVLVTGRAVDSNRCRAEVHAFDAFVGRFDSSPLGPQGIDIDLAMLVYTSGSTGRPKGVMMTHLNVMAAADSIISYLENTPDDVILDVLPLSFDYGLYQVIMSVRIGATVVLEKSFAYPQYILGRVATERVTGLPLVPTMVAILLQAKNVVPGMFPHIRYITNTAAALPPAHIQRLQGLFPAARIYSMYGLTECKRCTYLPPEQLSARPASVGVAIPNTEAYVVGEDGTRVGPDVVGELVIRGGHVMKGYWRNQAETDRALRPGPFPWEKVLHTGDLFRTDNEGFLYFVGRKDDIIKTRGEKVSPKEIENVLYAIPGVKEAAVVGVPDPILGHQLKAVVVLADGVSLTTREVQQHCASHLEDFMVPQIVEFRDSLPKTDTGKIRRKSVE